METAVPSAEIGSPNGMGGNYGLRHNICSDRPEMELHFERHDLERKDMMTTVCGPLTGN